MDALGVLAAGGELGNGREQRVRGERLAGAKITDCDLLLVGEVRNPDFAGERACRVVGKPLERVGERLGRGLEERLERRQDLELVCEALCGRDLDEAFGDEPAELDELRIRRCDRLRTAEDRNDVVTDLHDRGRAGVVGAEDVGRLGGSAARHAHRDRLGDLLLRNLDDPCPAGAAARSSEVGEPAVTDAAQDEEVVRARGSGDLGRGGGRPGRWDGLGDRHA